MIEPRPVIVQEQDDAFARLGPGMIFACALKDDLARRARLGDRHAIETLLKAIPADLPHDVLQGERDRLIRDLAQRLRLLLPGATVNAIAVALAALGGRLDTGRRLDSRALLRLTADQRVEIESEIGEILKWAPAVRDGRRWPAVRRIVEIIE